MARGHRLNISIVLAAVHGLSGLFGAVSAVETSLFHPLPPVPILNKPPRFCGHKAKWSAKEMAIIIIITVRLLGWLWFGTATKFRELGTV